MINEDRSQWFIILIEFIGIEKDRKYFEIAMQRIKEQHS